MRRSIAVLLIFVTLFFSGCAKNKTKDPETKEITENSNVIDFRMDIPFNDDVALVEKETLDLDLSAIKANEGLIVDDYHERVSAKAAEYTPIQTEEQARAFCYSILDVYNNPVVYSADPPPEWQLHEFCHYTTENYWFFVCGTPFLLGEGYSFLIDGNTGDVILAWSEGF